MCDGRQDIFFVNFDWFFFFQSHTNNYCSCSRQHNTTYAKCFNNMMYDDVLKNKKPSSVNKKWIVVNTSDWMITKMIKYWYWIFRIEMYMLSAILYWNYRWNYLIYFLKRLRSRISKNNNSFNKFNYSLINFIKKFNQNVNILSRLY